jgi:hypothetical protein
MPDDLRICLKELKKKMKQQKVSVLAEPIEKIDVERQGRAFSGFVNELMVEFEKSSDEYKYVDTIVKEFDGMRLVDIRFAVEKSYDRYDKIISLMKRYEENFDEEEFAKYNSRYLVLEKMFSFMVGNAMGEYKKIEKDGVVFNTC